MLQEEQKNLPEDLDFLDILAQQPTQGPPGGILALPGLDEEEEEENGGGGALPPRTPWWRRRGVIIALFLLALIILGIIFLPGILFPKRQVQFQTAPVTQGNISQTITATGPLQGGTYNINFKGNGTISEIDVVVGQHVIQGQLVAKLDPVSLQDAVNQAQAAYNAALTALNADLANSGATAGVGGANISAAQTGVNNAVTNVARVKAQGQANVNAARTTLTNAEAQLAATEQQGQASVNAAQTTLNNAEAQLNATEQQGAASVAQAQTALNNAEQTLANTTFTTPSTPATTTMVMNTTGVSPGSNCTLTNTTGTAPNITYTYTCTTSPGTTNTKTCAQDPTNPACTMAEAAVNSAQAALNTAQAMANTADTNAQAAVNAAQAGVNTAEAQAITADTNAQAAVNAARAGVTTAQRNADVNNANAQAQLNTAQKSLDTAIANSNLSNTTSNGTVKNAASQAQSALTSLNTAQHNLQNATLLAPHAGTVTVINGTVGGTPGVPANASTSITGTSGTFVQIVDASSLQAVANVNESDTGNLKVGDTAQFTVSAYGNREFTGVVSAISPNGTTVANVVTFPVYVNVDTNDLQGATLLPGMTANLTINVAQRISVLLIPVTAVSFAHTATTVSPTTGGQALVTATQADMANAQAQMMLQQLMAQNPAITADMPMAAFVLVESSTGEAVATPVVLGLTDGTNYEVLAGLKAGQTIIIGVASNRRGGGGGAPGGGGGPGGGGFSGGSRVG